LSPFPPPESGPLRPVQTFLQKNCRGRAATLIQSKIPRVQALRDKIGPQSITTATSPTFCPPHPCWRRYGRRWICDTSHTVATNDTGRGPNAEEMKGNVQCGSAAFAAAGTHHQNHTEKSQKGSGIARVATTDTLFNRGRKAAIINHHFNTPPARHHEKTPDITLHKKKCPSLKGRGGTQARVRSRSCEMKKKGIPPHPPARLCDDLLRDGFARPLGCELLGNQFLLRFRSSSREILILGGGWIHCIKARLGRLGGLARDNGCCGG